MIGRDAGRFKSETSWTRWEFEYHKFISLGESNLAKQQVVAFSYWLSDTPSWKTTIDEEGSVRIKNRPPYYDETSLGGMDRLRAYPVNRFSDRSGLHYALEYRIIPHWNPLSKFTIKGASTIDWWQWVGFVEAGRVAGDFDLGELHRDMKTDVGFGLRAYRQGILGRLDIAFASEGWAVRAMLGQAF